MTQKPQSRSSASRYNIFSTRPEYFFHLCTYQQLHVEVVNSAMGFKKCLGKAFIKETKNNSLSCCMCMKSTLEDFFFHLEYCCRAPQTSKILGILCSSSSNTLSIKKSWGEKGSESYFYLLCLDTDHTFVSFSWDNAEPRDLDTKQTGERDKSVRILCPVYNFSQSSLASQSWPEWLPPSLTCL